MASSDASTSSSNKQFVTTGATTLAVTDLRKGVIAQSDDQEEALLCSAFVDKLHTRGNSTNGRVLVGGAGGVITLWQQGFWEDQDERIVLDRSSGGGETLDVITKVPDEIGNLPGRKVAVGLGNGQIRFVRISGDNMGVGLVRHDEMEGVVAINFDVAGRMISSGGAVVKIWHEKVEDRDEEEEEEEEEDEEEEENDDDDNNDDEQDEQDEQVLKGKGINGIRKRKAADGVLKNSDDSDNESDDEEEEEEKPKRRRKRRRNKAVRPNSGPGVMAFKGL